MTQAANLIGTGLATTDLGAGVGIVARKNRLPRLSTPKLATKRTFCKTRTLKADPATTAIAVSAILPSNLAPLIAAAIGISSSIFILLFIPSGISTDLYILFDIVFDYLKHIENFNSYISSSLSIYNADQLQEILRSYQAIILIHEQVFQRSASFVNTLEGSPLFDMYNDLFERWREDGNSLMETYRNVERILGISISDSNIEPQWFEN